MSPDLSRFERLRQERRRRVFFVASHTMMGYVQSKLTIEVKGLPEDAIFEGVIHDWEAGGFTCAVFHESFDPVPLGQMTPLLEGDTWVHPAEPACIHGPPCPLCVADAKARRGVTETKRGT